jgi:hypothetical protein
MSDNELISIITKFSESEWDVIDAPAKAWLNAKNDDTKSILITAIKKADEECGTCGCEMDALYKKALSLLAA